MNYHSNADLGGTEVHGLIVREAEGELFHAPSEARIMALTLAMGATGLWNIDMSRSARETLIRYRDLGYYEIWLEALEKLLLSSGVLEEPPARTPQVLSAARVAPTLAQGSAYSRPAAHAARFAVNQRVRTCARQPEHHTRLPAYARGKIGTIARVHGAHVFPDTNARGLGECPQWLYTIAFDATDLWGKEAPAPESVISVDAWEPYLELP